MSKGILKLDQRKKQVQISELILEQPVIFEYFDKQPSKEREALLIKAILLGTLALMEERISAFLAKTSNTLGTELLSLKYIYDLNEQLFYRTTGKGREAEVTIAEHLESFLRQRGYSDAVDLAGDRAGTIKGNKTGDIVVSVDNNADRRVVIECKLDRGKRLGAFRTHDPFVKGDTAISQLLESAINRGAKEAIIVFDRSAVDGKLEAEIGSAKYFPKLGFVSIIDIERGDFSSLFLCYELARSAIVAPQKYREIDFSLFALLVERLFSDLDAYLSLKKSLKDSISQQLEMIKVIDKASLRVENFREILGQFLEEGTLSQEKLLELYGSEPIKAKFKKLEEEASKILLSGT
jgi:hypothetical protein